MLHGRNAGRASRSSSAWRCPTQMYRRPAARCEIRKWPTVWQPKSSTSMSAPADESVNRSVLTRAHIRHEQQEAVRRFTDAYAALLQRIAVNPAASLLGFAPEPVNCIGLSALRCYLVDHGWSAICSRHLCTH